MADTYKILAQDVAASIDQDSGENQANIIYTVPENTQTAVSSISLTSTAASPVNYKLGIIKSAEANSSVELVGVNKHLIFATNATGASFVFHSIDGITFTAHSAPSSIYSFAAAYGNGKFVTMGGNGPVNKAYYSSDGITWIETSLPYEAYWVSVVYGNNKFIATSRNAGSNAYSEDGITWTQLNIPVTAASVTYGDGKFVATGTGLSGAYSVDGITWTLTNMTASRYWSSVTYGNGKFVAVSSASYNSGSSSTGAYSTDGISWTTTSMSVSTVWKSVTYGDGKFVAVGSKLRASYSTNGINWTESNLLITGGTSNWSSVAYGNGKFVASNHYNGYVSYSTDGITWTPAKNVGGSQLSVDFNPAKAPVLYAENVPMPVYSISNAQTIIPTREIEPNATHELSGGITLSAGDQIRVYSNSEDLIAQVYGVEIA